MLETMNISATVGDAVVMAKPGLTISGKFSGASPAFESASTPMPSWTSFATASSDVSSKPWSNAPAEYGSINFPGTGTTNTYMSDAEQYHFANRDFTIEVWLYHTNTSTAQRIFDCGGGAGIAYSEWLLWSNPEIGSGYIFSATTSNTTFEIGPENASSVWGAYKLNQWTHLAISRVGNTIRCFQDGILQKTFTIPPTAALFRHTRGMTVGMMFNSSWGSGARSLFFTGKLAGVCITNGLGRYRRNFTPVRDYRYYTLSDYPT